MNGADAFYAGNQFGVVDEKHEEENGGADWENLGGVLARDLLGLVVQDFDHRFEEILEARGNQLGAAGDDPEQADQNHVDDQSADQRVADPEPALATMRQIAAEAGHRFSLDPPVRQYGRPAL